MPKLLFLTFAREKYLPAVLPTLAPSTRDTTTRVVEALVNEFGHEEVGSLDAARVERWWGALRARGRAGRTDNFELLRLRHMMRTAIRWRLIHDDPTAGIKRARESKGRVRFFGGPEERERVLAAANPTLRDFLTVAHYTAARRRQVWALAAGDVDLARGTVTFRSPKGSEYDLTVPIHSDLRPVLERRCAGRGPRERLFPEYDHPQAATRAWRRLCGRLGLGDFRLHDWRHDTLSWVVMRTGSLKIAQALAGHTTPTMTNRYAHLADRYLREGLEAAL